MAVCRDSTHSTGGGKIQRRYQRDNALNFLIHLNIIRAFKQNIHSKNKNTLGGDHEAR